jgi:hypothetical protein
LLAMIRKVPAIWMAVPGGGPISGGAAYRNRTDDLRITSASL